MIRIRTVIACFSPVFAACSPAERPEPIAQPSVPAEAVQAEIPRNHFAGTRIGQLLADLQVSDAILMSGPMMRDGPPGMGPIPIPVQDKEWITVALSNDTDHEIEFPTGSPFLFRVSATDASGQEIFEKSEMGAGVSSLSPGEVRKFEVTWPVRGLALGMYTVTLRLGEGGSVMRTTRLY